MKAPARGDGRAIERARRVRESESVFARLQQRLVGQPAVVGEPRGERFDARRKIVRGRRQAGGGAKRIDARAAKAEHVD